MQLTKNRIKEFVRSARDGGYPSAWGYFRSPEIWRLIPRLAQQLPIEDFEINVLSGQTRLTMALWMMASWMAATGRQWKFVIHDDGTLCAEDAVRVKRVMPLSRVILSSESNPVIDEMLSKYPLCHQCRNIHPFGRRLFDMPLFSLQDRIVSIDTDILFFAIPTLMLQSFEKLESDRSFFLEDFNDASLVSLPEAKRLFNIQLVQRANAGIIGIHKRILSLEFLEECLARTGILKKDSWYIEQTLFGLAASRFSQVELLPADYVMSLDGRCPPHAVARHYVGAVRHLFYSEGLAKVRPMLKC
jgi:hypothetical protein